MRMLLGLLGEIHQPMRAIARVTPKFPAGDHGGKLFPVQFNDKVRNLKALWDSGMGKLKEYKRVRLCERV